MEHNIETALRMLDARGGALDKKAAEIIRDLFAQVIGKKVGEKLDETMAQSEVKHLLGVIAELREQISGGQKNGETIAKSKERHEERGALLAEINLLRLELADANDRIAKLMARQQDLMNAVTDAQLCRPPFYDRNEVLAQMETLRRDLIARNDELIAARAQIARLKEGQPAQRFIIDSLQRESAGLIQERPDGQRYWVSTGTVGAGGGAGGVGVIVGAGGGGTCGGGGGSAIDTRISGYEIADKLLAGELEWPKGE